MKIGEYPSIGDPEELRQVEHLLGKGHSDLLRLGQRAEAAGLGIGAFAYYRRIVEEQKHEILARMRAAAERIGAAEPFIEAIERGQKARSFAESIDRVKDVLPAWFFIGSHNPLKTLHSFMSGGLHGRPDQECLEAASIVREVLVALAMKVHAIVSDDEMLEKRLGQLSNPNSRHARPKKEPDTDE